MTWKVYSGVSFGGPVQDFPPFVFFSWREPFSSNPLQTEIKTDRQATKREATFDNAHQPTVYCDLETIILLHSNNICFFRSGRSITVYWIY
jgi:hypothetical protein